MPRPMRMILGGAAAAVVALAGVGWSSAAGEAAPNRAICVEETVDGMEFYRHPDDPTKYYICDGAYRPTLKQCGRGERFSQRSLACVAASDVAASDRPNPAFDCPEADGLFAAENPEKFWQCKNHLPRIKDCPSGLYFDDATQICDWPKDVEAAGDKAPAPSRASRGRAGSRATIRPAVDGKTTLAAAPATYTLKSAKPFTLQATLSGPRGDRLQGFAVLFSYATHGTTLCGAYTNANGVARCSVTGNVLGSLSTTANASYTAEFYGNGATLLPAIARGKLTIRLG